MLRHRLGRTSGSLEQEAEQRRYQDGKQEPGKPRPAITPTCRDADHGRRAVRCNGRRRRAYRPFTSPSGTRCDLFALGAVRRPGMFYASGSPRLVASSTGGDVLGADIGMAIQQKRNHHDCMEIDGWTKVQPRVREWAAPRQVSSDSTKARFTSKRRKPVTATSMSALGSPGEVAMCGGANHRHYTVRCEKAIAFMITRYECLCCVASRSTTPEAGARPNASALPRPAFRPAQASHSPQRQTPQVHQRPHWRLRPEGRPPRLHPHPSRPAD